MTGLPPVPPRNRPGPASPPPPPPPGPLSRGRPDPLTRGDADACGEPGAARALLTLGAIPVARHGAARARAREQRRALARERRGPAPAAMSAPRRPEGRAGGGVSHGGEG